MKVQYDGYYGIQSVSKKLSMMNAYQFAEFAKDGHDNAYLDANPGGSPDDPNGMRPNSWERIPTELFPYLNGDKGLTDTDWQDAIFVLLLLPATMFLFPAEERQSAISFQPTIMIKKVL